MYNYHLDKWIWASCYDRIILKISVYLRHWKYSEKMRFFVQRTLFVSTLRDGALIICGWELVMWVVTLLAGYDHAQLYSILTNQLNNIDTLSWNSFPGCTSALIWFPHQIKLILYIFHSLYYVPRIADKLPSNSVWNQSAHAIQP